MCFVLGWTGGAPRLRQLDDAEFEFVDRGAALTIYVPEMLVVFSSFFVPSPLNEQKIALVILWGVGAS